MCLAVAVGSLPLAPPGKPENAFMLNFGSADNFRRDFSGELSCTSIIIIASHLFWDRCVVGGTANGNTWELVKIRDARVVLQFTELKSGGKVLHFCLKPSQ